MPFFEKLEAFYTELQNWENNDAVTKIDVIKSSRSHVSFIVKELLATPHLGSGFSHPSDALKIDHIRSNVAENNIVFLPDKVEMSDE
jgi:hypothetical protein